MKYLIALLALLPALALAQAQVNPYPKELVWAPPTTRVDGSALPAEEIAGYRYACKREGDTTEYVYETTVELKALLDLMNLTNGWYNCSVLAVNIYGAWGESTEVTRAFKVSQGKKLHGSAPGNMSATTN